LTTLQIDFFLQVAQTQNISQVARDNYISQPAVSSHVRNLEEELGVTLFERINKSIRLTTEGHIYYQLFSKFMDELANVKKQLDSNFLEQECELHLGIPSSWHICTAIYETVQSFAKNHPNVHISINAYSFKSLLSALRRGKLDIIVYIDALLEDNTQFTAYPLGQVERIFAYSPSYHLCAKKNLTVWDFKDECFIYHIDDGFDLSRILLMDTCRHCGFDPYKFHTSPNTDSMLLEAQQGIGVALLNDMVRTSDLECFALDMYSDISLIVRKNNNNPITSAFINKVLFRQSSSANPKIVCPQIQLKHGLNELKRE